MFNVQYPTAQVKGQELSKKNAAPQPKVNFSGTAGKLYTLIMVDPDAPAADWLHWLVINNDDTGSKKEQLVPYNPPTPPSGIHRYIFYLCEQSGPLNIKAPTQRGNFNTQNFLRTNKLRIIGKKQFTTRA